MLKWLIVVILLWSMSSLKATPALVFLFQKDNVYLMGEQGGRYTPIQYQYRGLLHRITQLVKVKNSQEYIFVHINYNYTIEESKGEEYIGLGYDNYSIVNDNDTEIQKEGIILYMTVYQINERKILGILESAIDRVEELKQNSYEQKTPNYFTQKEKVCLLETEDMQSFVKRSSSIVDNIVLQKYYREEMYYYTENMDYFIANDSLHFYHKTEKDKALLSILNIKAYRPWMGVGVFVFDTNSSFYYIDERKRLALGPFSIGEHILSGYTDGLKYCEYPIPHFEIETTYEKWVLFIPSKAQVYLQYPPDTESDLLQFLASK